jgi:hypothetical protein
LSKLLGILQRSGKVSCIAIETHKREERIPVVWVSRQVIFENRRGIDVAPGCIESNCIDIGG